jgi:hypothetical protein
VNWNATQINDGIKRMVNGLWCGSLVFFALLAFFAVNLWSLSLGSWRPGGESLASRNYRPAARER